MILEVIADGREKQEQNERINALKGTPERSETDADLFEAARRFMEQGMDTDDALDLAEAQAEERSYIREVIEERDREEAERLINDLLGES